MRFTMRLLALFILLGVSLAAESEEPHLAAGSENPHLAAGSSENPHLAGLKNPHNVCRPITITCACKTDDKTTYVPLELETTSEEFMNNQSMKCMAVTDPYQACANMSCHFTLKGSGSGSNGKDFLSFFYPMEIYIPAGGYHDGHRWAREAAPCQIPPLKNAAIKCWKWPSWITCDVSCIYGHAISDAKESVTKKSVNCRLTENVWKPQEIQDCKPYLNCKARLVKPGTLKCKEPISEPAYCEISCLDYDDFDATSLQRYQCTDETFGKSLPHCAVLKSGVPTVRKPQ